MKTVFVLLLACYCLFTDKSYAKEENVPPPTFPLQYEYLGNIRGPNDKFFKVYHFFSEKLEREQKVVLIITRLEKSKSDYYDLYLEKDGTLTCNDSSPKEFFLSLGSYANGEGIDVRIVPYNEKNLPFDKFTICEHTSIVPYPIISQNAQGATIEVKIMTPDGNFFLISGKGFTPNVDMTFVSRSCQERIRSNFKTDSTGSFAMFYGAAVIKKREGSFEVIFTPKDGDAIKIQSYWGKKAFEYIDRN